MPDRLRRASGAQPAGTRCAAGFSMLEVLVAMAVLSVLVVVLASVLDLASSNWIDGSSRTERRKGGRAVTAFMQKELAAAMLPIDRFASKTTPNLQFVVNPPGVTDRHASAIFFQAPLATDASSGDILALGYFIRWTRENGRPKAILCRLAVDQSTADFRVYEDLNWLSAAYLDAQAPADSANDYRGFFVDNVIGLWIRCLDRDGAVLAGATQTFDSRTAATDLAFLDPNVNPGEHVLPASVEISLVAIDGRTADRLTDADQAEIISAVDAAENADDFVRSPSLPEVLRRTATAYTTRTSMENAR